MADDTNWDDRKCACCKMYWQMHLPLEETKAHYKVQHIAGITI